MTKEELQEALAWAALLLLATVVAVVVVALASAPRT